MYPSWLTITPEPRPCSVSLPCLCGALPPKNCRNASSENERPVCPRETVCVVNTVTTLGATFSTTGAKLVIIPSRVCCGCCATTGDKLVCTQNTATAKSAHDFRIPLCMMALPAKENRTHSQSRLFFWFAKPLHFRPLRACRTGALVKPPNRMRPWRASLGGASTASRPSHFGDRNRFTGEALESDEAAASDYIFLRTSVSVLL